MTLSCLTRAAAGLLLAAAAASSNAAEWAGRGVYPFQSSSGCPAHAPGDAGAQCNRVAIDDARTRVTFDRAAQVIRFTNTQPYAHKMIVGDVLLQGSGETAEGQRVPLNFHIVVSKSGDTWSVNRHVHAPVHGRFRRVQIDGYQVEAAGALSTKTLATPEDIVRGLEAPALMARAADELVQVRDNRAAAEGDPDITIALGLGKAAFKVMRAQLHTPATTADTLEAVLETGTWSIDLHALTGRIPDHVIQREMFLFGMASQALLKPLMARGFAKGDTLTVGAVKGQGYLRFGGQQEAFPMAADTARRFLQQSFVGLILGWQQQENLRRVR